jgi:hypothetical protein
MDDLLLSTTNDQNFRISCVDLFGTLRLPADGPVHVPVGRRQLGKLFELFSNCVHGVNLPAVLREDGVDHGGSQNKLGLERHHNLQLSKVVVWTDNLWGWFQESKVRGLGSREQILGSFQNRWSKVEGALVPCESELVAPDTYIVLSVISDERHDMLHLRYHSRGTDS